jgi:hypothetical protein
LLQEAEAEPAGAIIRGHYLVPLLWFVNGVAWALIVLHLSGHLR